jgi:hypothetical protein
MTRLAVVLLVVLVAVGGVRVAKAAARIPDSVFPVGAISGTVSHQIAKLGVVASALAHRRVIVNCWATKDWTRLQAWAGDHDQVDLIGVDGFYSRATRRIQLSPDVCQVLAQAIARSAKQPLFTAWAITTLAHESAHASGLPAEAAAECRAIASEPRAAQLLGIAKATSERLQHIYRGTLYPTYKSALNPGTPSCPAGQPGVLVPDRLGTSANLRPLVNAAKQVAPSLPRWRNIGGAYSPGPLSPCAAIKSRTEEVARFGYTLLGPDGEEVDYGSATLETPQVYAAALARLSARPRCVVHRRRTLNRWYHSTDTIALSPIPDSITRLSPRVRAFRVLFTSYGKKWNRDEIHVLNRARRTDSEVSFAAPAGRLPISVEVRAVAAILRATA